MIKRRDLLAGVAATVALPLTVFAQPAPRKARVGWLVFGGSKLGPIDTPVVAGLAKRGLVDGQNLEIVFRYANGSQSRVNELAKELVGAKPDVLFGLGSEVIKSMFDLTRDIPIVGGISE